MIGKQWTRILAVTAAVLIIWTGNSNGEKCVVSVKESPKDPAGSSLIQIFEGKSKTVTCVYEASSSCSDVIVKIYHRITKSRKAYPVDGSYWGLTRGLSYVVSPSKRNGNEYSVSMTIEAFYKGYDGGYYCVINETSNMSNSDSSFFGLFPIQPEAVPTYSECYSPRAENITAIPHIFPNGSVAVRLAWQLSIKENNNMKFCSGSKRWKVGVLTYSDISVTPGDHEVSRQPAEWVIVPRRDTNFSFSAVLNTHTYYLFQVGHNNQDILNAGVFASHVYYFGHQEQATIDTANREDVINLFIGQDRSVPCVANGYPPPHVLWVKSSGNGVAKTSDNDSSVLELNSVTLEDAGDYYCIASNTLVNPPGKITTPYPWRITVNVAVYDPEQTGLYCKFLQMDDSSHCINYLHPQLQVFYNSSDTLDTEEFVGKALSKLDSIDTLPAGNCRDLAYSMTCHTAYPYCDNKTTPGLATPRIICSNACDEFITGKCSGTIPQDSALFHLITKNCDHSGRSGGDPPECIPLSYYTSRRDQQEPIEDTGDCMRGNGRGYTGNQVLTKSNKLCQRWSVQEPQSHPMLPDIYRSELETAGQSCRNPGGLGSQPWCYTEDHNMRWEYCDIPKCDICEPYLGDVCLEVKGYSGSDVFIRMGKNIHSWENIEEKLSLSLIETRHYYRPTEGCMNIFTVLLCHSAFPHCDEEEPEQLCGAHCQLEESLRLFCPDVYDQFINFLSTNQAIVSNMRCDVNETDSQCMQIHSLTTSDVSEEITFSDNCYTGNGQTYNGTKSQTRMGVSCQAWDSNNPHSHPFMSDKYPELNNSKNYCRNPGGVSDKPWCFTESETVWDYCDVPDCATIENEPELDDNLVVDYFTGGEDVTSNSENQLLPGLVTSLVLFVLLLVVAIVVALIFMRWIQYRQKKVSKDGYLSQCQTNIMQDQKYVLNPEYTKAKVNNFSNSLAIPENFSILNSKQIKYVSQLGQGNFGIVFKGRAYGLKDDTEEEIDVAVKTLKEEASSVIVQNFIDEAKLMFSFDHPNILKIHGVCMSEMPYQLVFEFMDEGDLTQFLRSRASSTQRRLLNPFGSRSRTESSYSDDPPSLTKTELLYICKQIASGMEYLSNENHVHRDLACRNCLIKSDLVVKIGDFGMSRNLYSKDYYRINGQAVLPVRWMSPESLIYGKFSIEGDVWSFGVVMWEVFSFALQPYYGISNEEVTEAIRRGKTLNRPDDCPSEVYNLMKECWSMDPSERLTFTELHSELSQLHQISSISGSCKEYETDDDISIDSDIPSDAFFSEDNLSVDIQELEDEL